MVAFLPLIFPYCLKYLILIGTETGKFTGQNGKCELPLNDFESNKLYLFLLLEFLVNFIAIKIKIESERKKKFNL